MRRFRWKRRRAALALLPALAMMITAGIAGAAAAVPTTGTAPEATASGSPATGISLAGHRNVMAHHTVKFRGRVTPGGNRAVVVQVGGRMLHTHTQADGTYRVRWHAAGSGTYRARATVANTTVRSHRMIGLRLPAGRGLVLRPRPLRRRPGLRRHAEPREAGRREQDAPLRLEGHAPLSRQDAHRPRDRQGPLRGQPRVRPDRGHKGQARIPLHGDRAHHALVDARVL